jgi:ELWxxDGT repeat protein
VNGTLFFTASDGMNGTELWKSDGTDVGTVLVQDVNPGASSSTPNGLTNVNGTLFFSANTAANGFELWKSNGTTAGTVLVKDINPGAGSGFPRSLTNVSGTLFFSAATSAAGTELWKSDGTAAGTVMVKDINPGAASAFNFPFTPFVTVNGTAFFAASTSTGTELWKSDGTAAGTVIVKDIAPGAGSSSPSNLIGINGTLFFTAFSTGFGTELWKSDGTDAGTVMVKDIYTGPFYSAPANLTNVSGTLFFTASSPVGVELWKSDGTAAGTVLVADLFPGNVSSTPMSLTAFNGRLLFNGFNGINGNELWTSDGTAAGTVLVKDIYRGLFGSIYPGNAQLSQVMIALSHSAALAASDGFTGLELWKTNGVGVGTMLVQDIFAGPASSTPQLFMQAANQVFFVASDLTHGAELWAAPLAALDVSLEEQIDELLVLLNDPALQSLTSLSAQLTTARIEVGNENIAGQFVAARAHLTNFIKEVQGLVDHGRITAAQAQPLLDGADAILEQIEGNHPKTARTDQSDESDL